MKILYLFLTLSLAFVSTASFAGKTVNTEDNPSGAVEMREFMADKATLKAEQQLNKQLLKQEKKAYRSEKRMAKLSTLINKKMAKTKHKSLGGMDDPVDKWVWYAIILGGASILFWILASAVGLSGGFGFAGVLAILGTLCFLGGVACVIYWAVKKWG